MACYESRPVVEERQPRPDDQGNAARASEVLAPSAEAKYPTERLYSRWLRLVGIGAGPVLAHYCFPGYTADGGSIGHVSVDDRERC